MKEIDLKNKAILVTGAAGFIGAALCRRLLAEEEAKSIIGIDNLDSSYDVSLKEYRLKNLQKSSAFIFVKGDVSDKDFLSTLFVQYHPQVVVHLAAKAGVRNSITNPESCITSNIIGFFNILECCRSYPVAHLIYASSSSVYGNNKEFPFAVENRTDTPNSLYAATKKSDELMAYAYSSLFDIPCTGLRFFTVYGPEGRPDMAYFSFTDKWREGKKIQLFNYGKCERDFTYIGDVVESLVRVMKKAPEGRNSEDVLMYSPCALYNVGNQDPRKLIELADILQQELVKVGVLKPDFDLQESIELVPMQPGDVEMTCADTSELEKNFGYRPSTPLREGLQRFAEWYQEFYRL